jgi:colanic acid biosynthesis glycosyl transferase WcaI
MMLPRLLTRQRRPDVVLYIGAQPAIAMAARVIAAVAGCPYFVNINDLASQAAADVGLVGARMRRWLERFEFAAYKSAAGASVLCQSFVHALAANGFPADRIKVIRSPIDVDQIRPVPRDDAFRRTHGIPEHALVVLHAGSMGRKQGLMNVIDAATLTRDADICWVLVGDGETLHELEEAVGKRELSSTVRFLPFQSQSDMAAMFAAADVLLLNQVSAVKDAVIPSKLLTYMAAGRPVIAAVNASSQGAEILQEADGGWLVVPENALRLAAAARRVVQTDVSTRGAIGRRNRAYAEAHFDQRKIVEAHEQFMCAGADVPLHERARASWL